MNLVIVTGMSGSGKSVVLDVLEDLGYYCIDNLPPKLLLEFALYRQGYITDDSSNNIAVGIDSRSFKEFSGLNESFQELSDSGINYRVLFVDCDDQKLMTRYKETRRNHPLLVSNKQLNLEEAIKKERELLEPLKWNSNYIIDTTLLSPNQLKEKINNLFANEKTERFTVQFVSFGFKFSIMKDADLIFDVRCLPNPFYEEELKNKTGLDQEVRDFVMGTDEAQGLFKRIKEYLDFSIPLYKREGKSQLVVGIGCTGGKHRSVTFAHLLNKEYENKETHTNESHRDIMR